MHYCLEDKVTDESETTTSGQFGNLFDAYDYDSFEKYKSLEDLINATKIDITDILKSFTFGSYIFNSQFVADAKESFEADWKTNLHHLYGHCHTFDHSRMDKLEKVKVITKAENEVSGSLFQSFLLFDVSSLFPILNWFILVDSINSWMQNSRYKHENLDRVQGWATITEGEGNGDESDKHI